MFELEHLIELKHLTEHLIELEHLPELLMGGVVRRQNTDLKFCSRIFYYAAGKSGMCMEFLLVEWKIDEFFISGDEKIKEFFISVEEKRRGVAEQ